ncbi:MAG TPA: N-acyl homoserine lactonase family protein, partial [Dehalococcoidia bacterium]|nr:N-acyl homoserine lactonase family protein [Dehalococcoidia bacterium]
TRRGLVVLTSDASHYYENVETERPFATTHDAERVIAGFKTLRELADSPQHLVPGHDPEVLKRYEPAAPKLEGLAVRLDAPPGR